MQQRLKHKPTTFCCWGFPLHFAEPGELHADLQSRWQISAGLPKVPASSKTTSEFEWITHCHILESFFHNLSKRLPLSRVARSGASSALNSSTRQRCRRFQRTPVILNPGRQSAPAHTPNQGQSPTSPTPENAGLPPMIRIYPPGAGFAASRDTESTRISR